jgi:SAM-dependent methyltransferase
VKQVGVVTLRDRRGRTVPLPVDRWFGAIEPADGRVLDALGHGPVLDVGCGPGRHVVALASRGIPALGIDITTGALDVARGRGACVLHRSVFDRVPAAGRWAGVLLLDGNVGIGGAPGALLRRVRDLLRPGGTAIVELDAPSQRCVPRIVHFEVDAVRGPWFTLSVVTVDDIADLARASGFVTKNLWHDDGRWFAALRCEKAA